MNYNLAQPFFESALRTPQATALFVGESDYSYAELARYARRIAGWLGRDPGRRSGHVGILASRTLEVYAGVLGTLWSGAAYIPINPSTPEDRLLRILDKTNLDALIADEAGLQLLTDRVLASAPRRILCGPGTRPAISAGQSLSTSLDSLADLPDDGPPAPLPVAEDALAYVLFTSGTTGTPKGVMIEAGSVAEFLRVAQDRCAFQPTDRFSQLSEMTFDASVLDLYSAWAVGASVFVVPAAQIMAPAKFIREHELTIWFAVPSTGVIMERMKMLKPGAFPSLRVSIFAGEALPLAMALAWQKAAPNSVVENFYGPTEVTVDCIAQRLADPPHVTRDRGTLAIGRPFSGIQAGIIDENLQFLPPERDGELVVAGRQLARGYLGDPELTAVRFPMLNGQRWYRTGDLAFQDASGVFHHLGRIDNQVKVLGNRVELDEVEAHLREVTGTAAVAAVAWPREGDRATGIVAFHCVPGLSRDRIHEEMKKRVPSYMVPSRIHELDALPMSAGSGKVDRNALVRMLEESRAQ